MRGETGYSGGTGWTSPGSVRVFRSLVIAAFLGWAAESRGAERPRQARRQAAPSASECEGKAEEVFFADAFTALQGSRPDFGARGSAPTSKPGAAAADTGFQTNAGVRWSTLISEGTLTDEIEGLKSVAAAATSRPTDFKGGGYDRAREAFSSLALAFAVIAEHEQDIRWKHDAATARDLFAQIGFTCKVGTDQSLAEARLGVVDLESLLAGEGPRRQPGRDGAFRWSDVATRSALMKRLEAAEAAILAGVASGAEFADGGRVLHEAEIVAVIAEVIRMPEFEDHDDDTYRGCSERMRDAALKLRDACEKHDAEAARAASSLLKTSCDTCHRDYRG